MSEPQNSEGYCPSAECFQVGQIWKGILRLDGFVKQALQSACDVLGLSSVCLFATLVKLIGISWSLLALRVSPASVTDVP